MLLKDKDDEKETEEESEEDATQKEDKESGIFQETVKDSEILIDNEEDDQILANALDDSDSDASDWGDEFEKDVIKEVFIFLKEQYMEDELKIFSAMKDNGEELNDDGDQLGPTKKVIGAVKKLITDGFKHRKIEGDLGEKAAVLDDKEDETTNETYAYWKIKKVEFKKFFLLGIKNKKTPSVYAKNINLYFYTRLLLYDICFLTLFNTPTLQVLIPLTAEIIYLYFIFRAKFTYNLFTSSLFFFKLAFQGYAIVSWLFVTLLYTFSTAKLVQTSMGKIRIKTPLNLLNDTWSDSVQYLALFLVFLAVFMENLFLLFKIGKVIFNLIKMLIKYKRNRDKKKIIEAQQGMINQQKDVYKFE